MHDTVATGTAITLCVLCGVRLVGGATLCPHHVQVAGAGWAATNRIMCDLLHRGVAPPHEDVAPAA